MKSSALLRGRLGAGGSPWLLPAHEVDAQFTARPERGKRMRRGACLLPGSEQVFESRLLLRRLFLEGPLELGTPPLLVLFEQGVRVLEQVLGVVVVTEGDDAAALDVDDGEDAPTQEMSSLDLGLLAVCAAAAVVLGLAPGLTPFQTAADSLSIPGTFESPLELPTSQDADVALSARDVELVQ